VKVKSIRGTNVVSIMSRQTILNYRALAQVEGFWDALCRDDALPSRSQIDPRGMEEALEYAFVLERIAPGIGRFRIAGMHLNELMGMEVRGMPLSAMFLPESRKELGKMVETTCAEPQVTTLTLKGAGSIGRPRIEAQMLLLPLCGRFWRSDPHTGMFAKQGPHWPPAPPVQHCTYAISTDLYQAFFYPVQQDQHNLADPSGHYTPKLTNKGPDDKRPALRWL